MEPGTGEGRCEPGRSKSGDTWLLSRVLPLSEAMASLRAIERELALGEIPPSVDLRVASRVRSYLPRG